MRWPLAAVLALARREEAAARAALAAALTAEAGRRGERTAAAAALETRRAAARDAAGRPVRVALAGGAAERARHLAMLARGVTRSAEALRVADAACADALRAVDDRAAAVARARRALRALEAHRGRWSAALARARSRREDAELDDVVSARPEAGS